MGPRRTSHRRNHDNASGPSSSESIQITSLPRGPVAMTPLDYRSAMDRVRAIDEADGQLEPWLRDYLHQAVWTIWHYLCICPDYIMTKAEFGIFTYFRGLYPQEFPFFATSSPIVELAIERYWRNTYANPQVLFDED